VAGAKDTCTAGKVERSDAKGVAQRGKKMRNRRKGVPAEEGRFLQRSKRHVRWHKELCAQTEKKRAHRKRRTRLSKIHSGGRARPEGCRSEPPGRFETL
jgi:hypothetical protein